MTTLNTIRHMEIFDAYKFNTPVVIIGGGASGSWLALILAKLGIDNITVWDFDTVEEHNVPNQAFGIGDIGKFKVDALQEMIELQTGTRIKIKKDRFTNQRLSGIVFMMVDSMSGRKEIWENSIKMKSSVKHLVEPRMGLEVGRVYNVNPTDLNQIKAYESTYYSDDTAEVSSCGASMSVITTAIAVASFCAKQLINIQNDVELDNEILVDFTNNYFMNARW